MITKYASTKDFLQLLQRFQSTEDRLRIEGIELPNGGRWQTYRSLIQKVCQGSGLSSRETQLLPECLLECENLTFAVEGVTIPDEAIGWQEKARGAISGGQESSTLEKGNTHPRNLQSELFVAALLRRGGLALRFEEPDILLDLSNGGRLGIAVKRVKSAKGIRNRTSAARDQLLDNSVDGIVALDLAFFRNSAISAPDLASAGEKLRHETESYALRNEESLITAAKQGGRAIGIMIATAKMAHLETTGEAGAIFSLYVAANKSDQRRWMVDEVVASIQESGAVWFNRCSATP